MRSFLLLVLATFTTGCSGGKPGQSKPTADDQPAAEPKRTASDQPSIADLAEGFVESGKRMSKIGLAMMTFHDMMGRYPAGTVATDLRVGLSWRVLILPYLDHESLYKQFKLDEAWDSEHNKKLVEKMPEVFASPGSKAPAGHTHVRTFVAVAGPHEAFMPRTAGKQTVRPPNGLVSGRQMSAIRDGTANTFLAVEAAEATVWTKPDELEYDPAKPPPKLGVRPGGFVAGMVSGETHLFPDDLPVQTLHLFITINDGQIMPADRNPLRANMERLSPPPAPQQPVFPKGYSYSTKR